MRWLKERMAAPSGPRHRIAVFHHPPFSVFLNPLRNEASERIREGIHGVLSEAGFCAAICGHQHAFYKTDRDGVCYVVSGGGGSHGQKLDASLEQPGDLVRRFNHFVGFRVEQDRIRAQVVDQYGAEAKDLAFTVCEHPREAVKKSSR